MSGAREHHKGQISRVLIANRGEIAVRIARTLLDLGLEAVMVGPAGPTVEPHMAAGSACEYLAGQGVQAYLNGADLIDIARRARCDALHPGYGFLSENAAFAQQVLDAGLIFIGPRPKSLAILGDKAKARSLASAIGVPILAGTPGGIDLQRAQDFMAGLPADTPVMVKAVAGGGGRGMRIVRAKADLADAFARCASEAASAFGNGALYLEQLMDRVRHIEVQVAGDSSGAVIHLWERDCSLQRRQQKILEIAPAPGLPNKLAQRLYQAAIAIARSVDYVNLGTIEFLVDVKADSFVFLEANPRLQVEHTITEAITGLDLVGLQISLAQGGLLADLGLTQAEVPAPKGFAMQARITAEATSAQGEFRAGTGTISAFLPPIGLGMRTDSACAVGQVIDPTFDPLLAKQIVHHRSQDFLAAQRRMIRALDEFVLDGVPTNRLFLRALAAREELVRAAYDTGFVEAHAAILAHDARAQISDQPTRAAAIVIPSGAVPISAPMAGKIGLINVAAGQQVTASQLLVVLEAMKMEHVIEAGKAGRIDEILVAPGAIVDEGQVILFLVPDAHQDQAHQALAATDPDHIRADLAGFLARRDLLLDTARPDAMAKRKARGQRSARANLDDLFDPGSFIEYGGFAIAAQRRRRSPDDLIANTPADGMIAGIGSINEPIFGEQAARCMGVAYDFTVLAGTQGYQNHRKKDRVFDLAEQWKIPVVLFAEGGGGRPGDVDAPGVAGLDVPSFAQWARLSGLVPRLGITSGRCFAGNAALLGCADTIIATKDSNIGMGGPAMIEGGGLGVFAPEAIGPADQLFRNGVIDVLVDDEAEAVQAAKKYMGYFQGAPPHWNAPDQRLLRAMIPENRLRAYDIRQVIDGLCDDGSVLELRAGYAAGMITALVRIEGRPFGLIANNPRHLGGAIDGDGADKAARFMQLCDGFQLPLISLCDTPGFMVGPEIESKAQVRRVSRMFVVGASLRVPTFTIVLRKGYGLGAQAMAAGGFHAPFFTIAWPTGEFGGMGLEGAVRLGYRKELEAEVDPTARQQLYEKLVARLYEGGKALSMASHFEIDAVIDPIETRHWLLRGLKSVPNQRLDQSRPRFIDTW